ncbi:2941_t:CDS:1, partial [Ambispora leptoticha]
FLQDSDEFQQGVLYPLLWFGERLSIQVAKLGRLKIKEPNDTYIRGHHIA